MAGDVGVNVAAPDAPLDVAGTGSAQPVVYVRGTSTEFMITADDGGDMSQIGTFSDDALRLLTNNLTAITIDTDQNVGIGTSDPEKKLHINHSGILIDGGTGVEGGDLSTRFIIDAGGSVAHDLMDLRNDYGTLFKVDGINDADDFVRVGIGTDSPENALDVQGGKIYNTSASVANDTLASQLVIKDNTTAYSSTPTAGISFMGEYNSAGSDSTFGGITCEKAGVSDADPGGIMKFYTTEGSSKPACAMTIDEDGNVGIGETDPDSKLHVKGAFRVEASDPNIIFYEDDTADHWWKQVVDGGNMRFDYDDDQDGVFTPYTTAFTIMNSGNVGINTASPDTELEIEGTGDPSIIAQIKGTTLTDTDFACFRVRGTGVAGTEALAELGVYYDDNSESDSATGFLRLEASDGILHFIWPDDDDDLRTSPTRSNIGKDDVGTVIGSQTSDERLKNISSDAFPYGLTEVNKLTPIQYSWKAKTNPVNKLGFGAQTIKSIIPESVYDTKECIDGYDYVEDENGKEVATPKSSDANTKLGMEYIQIIPVLVKAIQELSAKVTALENA